MFINKDFVLLTFVEQVNDKKNQWKTIFNGHYLLLACLVFFLMPYHAYATEVEPHGEINLASQMEIIIDHDSSINFAEIILNSELLSWQKNQNTSMNFGFQKNPIWLKTRVTNSSKEDLNYLLVVESPTLDYLDLFLVDSQQAVVQFSTGNARNYSNRLLDNRNFVFPITISAQSYLDIVLRVEEAGSLQAPISLWSADQYYENYQYQQTKLAIYIGILFTLVHYNLFLWLTVGSRAYAYYVLYIISMLFVWATQTGIGSQFIWPESPHLASQIVQVSVPLSIIFAALFGIHTLNLKSNEWLGKLNWSLIFFSITLILSIPFIAVATHLKISVVSGVLSSIVFLMTGFSRWQKGELAIKLFTVAWFAFLSGSVIYGATKLGVLPANIFTNNIIWIGSTVEGILLSFSLGARINQVQQDKLLLERQQLKSKMREFELENIAIKAEAESKAKSELIATFSHEVRTPINGILGMTDLLAESANTEEQKEFISVLKYSGQILLNLINDALDYSKIEAGKMTVESIETDLYQVVESSVAIFSFQARERGVALVTEISPETPRKIMADPVRLTQIISNLVSNGLKFTNEGEVRLSVFSNQADGIIRFEVNDTGIGINQVQQERLFQSFHQADKSTTRKYGGTGLGLSICKQLVLLMDGNIGVNSNLGEGACFWFEIPLVLADKSSDKPDEKTNNVETLVNEKRILVVEDNRINQIVLARYLEKMNCEVIMSDNGLKAVEQYQIEKERLDMIIIDYEMPEMDGVEASRQIREIEKQTMTKVIPIVMLTAHTMPETLIKLEQSGIDEVMFKPVKSEKLSDLLTRHLSGFD